MMRYILLFIIFIIIIFFYKFSNKIKLYFNWKNTLKYKLSDFIRDKNKEEHFYTTYIKMEKLFNFFDIQFNTQIMTPAAGGVSHPNLLLTRSVWRGLYHTLYHTHIINLYIYYNNTVGFSNSIHLLFLNL